MAHWLLIGRSGRWAEADDAQARMLRLEREYADEVGVPFHGH